MDSRRNYFHRARGFLEGRLDDWGVASSANEDTVGRDYDLAPLRLFVMGSCANEVDLADDTHLGQHLGHELSTFQAPRLFNPGEDIEVADCGRCLLPIQAQAGMVQKEHTDREHEDVRDDEQAEVQVQRCRSRV